MKNKDWVKVGQKVIMNNYGRIPIVLTQGKGLIVKDADENEYLDFLGGIAVNCLGHSNEVLINAAINQMKKMTHCSNLYWIPQQIELAEKIVNNCCIDKMFFCNSGAEANEAAIKLARKYIQENIKDDKYEIITMKKSFHGRTIATLSATGQHKYHKSFYPLANGFKYCEFNNIESLKENITDKTAAIMLEIIQGEGGVNKISEEFLNEINKLQKEKNILIIIDEVQTGIMRTGKFLAYQHYNVKPDIISFAKALGGGTAIGAIGATDKVSKAFTPGDHGSTFGGNPLACSCANAVMDLITDKKFKNELCENMMYFHKKLNELKMKKDKIKQIKGMGYLVGIEISESSSEVMKKCLENGLLIGTAGENVLRLAPALIVKKEQIDKALEIIGKVL